MFGRRKHWQIALALCYLSIVFFVLPSGREILLAAAGTFVLFWIAAGRAIVLSERHKQQLSASSRDRNQSQD